MRKWFLVFYLIYPLATTAQKDKELAITHVTVIDCTGAASQPNSTVIIGNGHISAVGPSDRVTIRAGVLRLIRICASGRTSSALVLSWTAPKKEFRTGSPCARLEKRGRQFTT